MKTTMNVHLDRDPVANGDDDWNPFEYTLPISDNPEHMTQAFHDFVQKIRSNGFIPHVGINANQHATWAIVGYEPLCVFTQSQSNILYTAQSTSIKQHIERAQGKLYAIYFGNQDIDTVYTVLQRYKISA